MAVFFAMLPITIYENVSSPVIDTPPRSRFQGVWQPPSNEGSETVPLDTMCVEVRSGQTDGDDGYWAACRTKFGRIRTPMRAVRIMVQSEVVRRCSTDKARSEGNSSIASMNHSLL